MEITFNEIKIKEIVNIYDGKKLGRAVDIVFDKFTGGVGGVIVPGDHKLFRKNEDIFIPISKIKKIGEDVILVKLAPEIENQIRNESSQSGSSELKNHSVYARYRRVAQKQK